MIRRTAALLLCALLLVRAAPAAACTLSEDTDYPTNFELVQLADAIVIASAWSQYGSRDEGGVLFRVSSVLKGRPPQRLRIEDAWIGTIRPSDLDDLTDPHPQSGAGMCNRYTFERDGRYLLFLQRGEDGEWHQLGYAYARINEDYAGENNPWMRSVRRYLRLQNSLPPMQQIAALRRMLETGRDRDGRRLVRPERKDIEDHLASLSPWKPTEMLVDAYERVERGEPMPFTTRSNTSEVDITAVGETILTMARSPAPNRSPAERDRLHILRALAEGEHPSAYPLFDRLWSSDPTPTVRVLALRYFAGNGHYPRVYRWIEQDLLGALPGLQPAEARGLLSAVGRVQRGDFYDGRPPRWRTDPHAAATWPELARRLDKYQARTFRPDEIIPLTPGSDELSTVPAETPR